MYRNDLSRPFSCNPKCHLRRTLLRLRRGIRSPRPTRLSRNGDSRACENSATSQITSSAVKTRPSPAFLSRFLSPPAGTIHTFNVLCSFYSILGFRFSDIYCNALTGNSSIKRDVDQVTRTASNRCHVRSPAISVSPTIRVRSNAGEIISSFHADEDDDDEETKLKASFPSRSAPTSPRGASDAPKLLIFPGGNAARTAVSGGRTQKAISFPVCYKNSFPAEPPSSGAHPLPLPPGSGGLPVKNQWQKGKLIGRGTFGSVYVGFNRYFQFI